MDNKETKEYLENFQIQYTAEEIISILESLQDLKVLVVGDSIIDIYSYCDVMGTSPKENIIVARSKGKEDVFAGGVLAVANHIAGFCKEVRLITSTGQDWEDFAKSTFRPNITLLNNRYTPTGVIKRRFIEPDSFHKLFSTCYIPEIEYKEKTFSRIEEEILDVDLVVVADFGHGLISEDTAHLLCSKNKFLALNVQTNSANLGFNLVTKYPSADYISLDELELRLACHEKDISIENLTELISRETGAGDVSVTLGKWGSLTHSARLNMNFKTPVLSNEVKDTVGAGDAFLSITSLLAYKQVEPEIIGFVGNAVAALKCKTICNSKPTDPTELYKFITTLLK